MVIHLITRTPLFGSVLAWLGRDVFLGVAIMMLVIFVLVAFVALIYGYRLENPPRRRPRRD